MGIELDRNEDDEEGIEEGPCAGQTTSWGKECTQGCLKPCTKKPNKTCCNRRMGPAQCLATNGGTFCGAPALIELDRNEDDEEGIEEGPCAGQTTSWGKECTQGCLKPCTKKPNKTCCNRRMGPAQC